MRGAQHLCRTPDRFVARHIVVGHEDRPRYGIWILALTDVEFSGQSRSGHVAAELLLVRLGAFARAGFTVEAPHRGLLGLHDLDTGNAVVDMTDHLRVLVTGILER